MVTLLTKQDIRNNKKNSKLWPWGVWGARAVGVRCWKL